MTRKRARKRRRPAGPVDTPRAVRGPVVPARKAGIALGIYGVGNAVTALAALLMPRAVDAVGLTEAFLALTPLLLGGAAVFRAIGRDAPGFAEASAQPGTQGSSFQVSGEFFIQGGRRVFHGAHERRPLPSRGRRVGPL